MTVKELIELNGMITDVKINVRVGGQLLEQLNIGYDVGRKPRFPQRVPRERKYLGNLCVQSSNEVGKDAIYLNKSINAFDDGKGHYDLKLKRIPAAWLDLVVRDWEAWKASSVGIQSRSGTNFDGQRININVLESGQNLFVKEPKKEKEDSEIEGQISLDDWNINVVTY